LSVESIAWKALYAITKFILTALSKVYLGYRAEGSENVPKVGGVIIACNHLSHLDPTLVGIGLPRHVFHIAKQELARVFFLRALFFIFGTILIDRTKGKKALETAREYLEKGRAIIIFPEGTRSTTGRLMKGKVGAALLAMKTGAPVVPAAIIGSDKCMPKHSRFIKPGKVLVKYGKPIYFERVECEEIPRHLVWDATRLIMEKIEELLPESMRPLPEEKLSFYSDILPEGADA